MNEQILMNILQFDDHPLSAITLINLSKKARSRTSLYLQSCNGNETFIFQIYRAVSHLGESLIFLSVPWDLRLYTTLITKPTNQSHI